MPDIKTLAQSRNVDLVNTFTTSLAKLTQMLSAAEPIKAAPSETLHQKKIVLPAYAGMIPAGRSCEGSPSGAPRIRGDDPQPSEPTDPKEPCSPHTRG